MTKNKKSLKLNMLTLCLMLLMVLPGCYIVKQSCYQLKLLGDMQPFSKVLADPKTPKPMKDKIRLVMKVKRFAVRELGLRNTGSYSHFIKIKGKFVAYGLSAAPKDQLKPMMWRFPVVGLMPYVGFFNKKDALKAENNLKKRGFDTKVRGIPAYSTLGFFKDPLVSTLLNYHETELANTVIHEMTHETVYIRNHVKFNEALAMFVGNQGALLFFEKYYGKKSKWVRYIKACNHDDLLFSKFVRKLSKDLKKFYAQPLTKEKKIIQRVRIYKKAQLEFKRKFLPKMRTENYDWFPRVNLNNAWILSFSRYFLDLTTIEKVYLYFDQDMKKTIAFFKKLKDIKADPEKLITLWLKSRKQKSQVRK